MRRLFGAMALLAIFASGCSDDSAKEIPVGDGKGDVKNDVGGDCSTSEDCVDGLECRDNLCQDPVAKPEPPIELVDLGQACDSSQYICRGGICDGGICKMYSNGETCDATHICPLQGDICFSGLCIAKAECQSDSQCQADTYCCTEESCETKNVCIPYGMGPRLNMNDACVYQTEPGLFEADLQCDWTGPEAGDPYPKSKSVVTPVLVAKTPHNPKSTSNTLIFTSFISGIWQPVDEAYQFGVIRLVDPESCKVIENIYDDNHYVTAGVALAVGVVDDTGYVSIFAQRSPH